MGVYVASRFHDYQRVRAMNDKLVEHGLEIEHDWTRSDEFDSDGHPIVAVATEAGGNNEGLSLEQRRRYATEDLNAAGRCDVLIIFADLDGYSGAYMEFGAAHRGGASIIVIKPALDLIFWSVDAVDIVETEEEAVHLAVAMISTRDAPTPKMVTPPIH